MKNNNKRNTDESINGKPNGSENLFKPTLSLYIPVETNLSTLNKVLELLDLADVPLPIEPVNQINLQITVNKEAK